MGSAPARSAGRAREGPVKGNGSGPPGCSCLCLRDCRGHIREVFSAVSGKALLPAFVPHAWGVGTVLGPP